MSTTIHLIVKPNQRVDLLRRDGDTLLAKIAAPAFEGKATAHLIKVLAAYFEVSPSQITVVKGALSTHKTVQITADAEAIMARLRELPEGPKQQPLL